MTSTSDPGGFRGEIVAMRDRTLIATRRRRNIRRPTSTIKGDGFTMRVSRLAGLLPLVFGLSFLLGLPGCGSGNPNEAEYAQHAPPGKPPDDPEDQKVAHRRERTRNISKAVQKIEAKGQAAQKTQAP
jgi:hypothetical protein